MPKHYVYLTINSERGEYSYSCANQDSLDTVMARALTMHPNMTSLVMCIVPDKDGMNVTFQKDAD